jgi:hypothetical protein
MFRDCLTATMVKISKPSSQRWMNSGIAYRGEFLMQNILEHHKDAEESMLSQVLEPSAPPKYFLKQDQISKFIERASEKKISLPADLGSALEKSLTISCNTQQSEEKQPQGRKRKATETTAKPTPLIQEEVPMSYVRRLLPSECEKLQGFPAGWTEIDIEP